MSKRFRASNAKQLMACPGSANLELALPGYVEPADKPGGQREKGTAMHAVLDKVPGFSVGVIGRDIDGLRRFQSLHKSKRTKYLLDPHIDEDWAQDVRDADARYDLLLSCADFTPKEMRFIADCMDYIIDRADEAAHQTQSTVSLRPEANVRADWLPSRPTVTCDLVMFNGSFLEVCDYKTGSIPVDAQENEQLMFYAASFLELAPRAKEIFMRIIQPGNESVWSCTREYLEQWMNTAINADRRIMQKDLTLRAGDHCTFCPANPHTRGVKSEVLCPVKMEQLYPAKVNMDEVFL